MVINIGTMDLYLLKRFYGNEIPQSSYMKLIQQEFLIYLNKSNHLISNITYINFAVLYCKNNIIQNYIIYLSNIYINFFKKWFIIFNIFFYYSIIIHKYNKISNKKFFPKSYQIKKENIHYLIKNIINKIKSEIYISYLINTLYIYVFILANLSFFREKR